MYSGVRLINNFLSLIHFKTTSIEVHFSFSHVYEYYSNDTFIITMTNGTFNVPGNGRHPDKQLTNVPKLLN